MLQLDHITCTLEITSQNSSLGFNQTYSNINSSKSVHSQTSTNFQPFKQFCEELGRSAHVPVDLGYYSNEFIDHRNQKIVGLEQIQEIIKEILRKKSMTKKNKKNWSQNQLVLMLWIIEKYNSFKQISVQQYSENDWESISALIPSKDQLQCLFKWLSLKTNKYVDKYPWTNSEDALLKSLVKQDKQTKWFDVSKQLYLHNKGFKVFRNAKQCRERWACYLNPKIKKGPWTPEEDILLLTKYLEMGKKWSNISKELDGRTQNAVKNRFNLIIEKKQKIKNRISDNDFIKNHIQNLELNSFMQTSTPTTTSQIFNEYFNRKNNFAFSQRQTLHSQSTFVESEAELQNLDSLSINNTSDQIGDSEFAIERKNTKIVTFKKMNIEEILNCNDFCPGVYKPKDQQINYKQIKLMAFKNIIQPRIEQYRLLQEENSYSNFRIDLSEESYDFHQI